MYPPSKPAHESGKDFCQTVLAPSLVNQHLEIPQKSGEEYEAEVTEEIQLHEPQYMQLEGLMPAQPMTETPLGPQEFDLVPAWDDSNTHYPTKAVLRNMLTLTKERSPALMRFFAPPTCEMSSEQRQILNLLEEQVGLLRNGTDYPVRQV